MVVTRCSSDAGHKMVLARFSKFRQLFLWSEQTKPWNVFCISRLWNNMQSVIVVLFTNLYVSRIKSPTLGLMWELKKKALKIQLHWIWPTEDTRQLLLCSLSRLHTFPERDDFSMNQITVSQREFQIMRTKRKINMASTSQMSFHLFTVFQNDTPAKILLGKFF